MLKLICHVHVHVHVYMYVCTLYVLYVCMEENHPSACSGIDILLCVCMYAVFVYTILN